MVRHIFLHLTCANMWVIIIHWHFINTRFVKYLRNTFAFYHLIESSHFSFLIILSKYTGNSDKIVYQTWLFRFFAYYSWLFVSIVLNASIPKTMILFITMMTCTKYDYLLIFYKYLRVVIKYCVPFFHRDFVPVFSNHISNWHRDFI